jgi:hypothetical protein
MAKTWYGSLPSWCAPSRSKRGAASSFGLRNRLCSWRSKSAIRWGIVFGTSDRAASSRATAACISLMITCLRPDCTWISRTERVLRQARCAKGSSTAQSRCVPLRAQTLSGAFFFFGRIPPARRALWKGSLVVSCQRPVVRKKSAIGLSAVAISEVNDQLGLAPALRSTTPFDKSRTQRRQVERGERKRTAAEVSKSD